MSESDIQAGARWSEDIRRLLADSRFGIVCITKGNANGPWLNFEAGALAQSLDDSRVVPYLVDLAPADVDGPLAHFQAVRATKDGTRKLVRDLHSRMSADRKLDVDRVFNAMWPEFQIRINDIRKAHSSTTSNQETEPVRSEVDLLAELVERVRGLERDVRNTKEPHRRESRQRLSPSAMIMVDARDFTRDPEAMWHIKCDVDWSVQSFLDTIYHRISNHVRAYSYDTSWVLRDIDSGTTYHSLGSGSRQRGQDMRTLKEAGLHIGSRLTVDRV